MKVKVTVELYQDGDDPMQTDITPLAQGIITKSLDLPGLIPSVRMRNIAEVVLTQIKTDSTEPQPTRTRT